MAACKVVALAPETKPYDRKMIEKEMQVHSALKHSNVLEFINAIVVEANGKSRYHPGIYMLLELAAGGDLFDKIGIPFRIVHCSKLISEDSSGRWYRRRDCPLLLHTDIIRNGSTTPSVMIHTQLNGPHRQDYIHREGVCHRDLKPENIMLDAAGVLKISDFGLCSVYKLKESGKTRLLSERCGSLPYIAPEVSVFQLTRTSEISVTSKLSGSAPYKAEPIDIWGIGVILFTMLVGSEPPPSIWLVTHLNTFQTHLGTSRPRIVSSSVPT